MEDKCVCCGEIIPEGRQVCPNCMVAVGKRLDLIDRQALLAKLKGTSRYFSVKFDIEEAPTVDAVEVVRCKDCKHREDGLCTLESVYDYPWYYTKDDDFCSYGERKVEDA